MTTFCFDATIWCKHGPAAAIVFEKVWFLMHKSEKAADFTTIDQDGVVWEHWTHLRLLEQFENIDLSGIADNVIGMERTLRRAVDDLVSAKLLIRKRSQVGFKLAINFKALQALVGYNSRYGLYPPAETECPDLDKVEDEAKEEPTAECPDLDKQLPGNTEIVQNGTDSMSKNGQTECPEMDAPYIYDSSLEDSQKDSLEEENKDSTTTLPNGSGATAPALPPNAKFDDLLDPPKEIFPPKDVFTAIGWVVYRKREITDTGREEILGAMARLKNIKTAQKEKLVLDTTMIEDFALWHVLLFWRGKDGFPTIDVFENEFRDEFILNWYDSQTNRKQLEWIKRDFSNWRTRLFNGDYAAFREEVQAYIADLQRQKREKTSKPQLDSHSLPVGPTPAVKVTDEEIDRILGGPS